MTFACFDSRYIYGIMFKEQLNVPCSRMITGGPFPAYRYDIVSLFEIRV